MRVTMPKRGWPLLALMLPVAAATQLFGRQAAVSTPVTKAGGPAVERRIATVDPRTIAAAIAEARVAIERRPGTAYVIRLPAGTFDLPDTDRARSGTIDVSRIDACPGGLRIAGAGAARTTLIFEEDAVGIIGRSARCITIADLTMTQRRREMSQGTVVSATPDAVVIDVPRGFPTPQDLLPREREIGRDGQEIVRRWIKRFRATPAGPQVIVDDEQAAWLSATKVGGAANRWRVSLRVRRNMPDFARGDVVGLKSKSGRDAYRFIGSDRITLRGVRWSVKTRGVLHRTDNVRIERCAIDRPAPIDGIRWAMSSSTGGPQIGQPDGPPTTGHVVVDNDFQATGDNALMFANAAGVMRDNRLSDTFGNAVRIIASPRLVLRDNVLVRAPVLREAPGPRRSKANHLPRAAAANDNDDVEPDRD